MRAVAIIGANFGDEGKGLMVDAVSGPGTLVVRYNGGAQAGHTVVTPEGRRHVFSHIGAGALRGAHTFLSRDFLANPLMWAEEVKRLGECPRLFVDPGARVTTPLDMMLNQAIEQARKGGRHGSCGMGVHETIVRSEALMSPYEDFPYRIRAMDLWHPIRLKSLIGSIQQFYLPRRLEELGLPGHAVGIHALNGAFEQFLIEAAALVKHSALAYSDLLSGFDHIVFEGAQGLLLDQDHHYFPHVTPSHTGMHNVAALCRENKIDTIRAIYVSRTYMTRHGAGPLPHETTELFYPDDTNNPNPWQGSLRYGYLDYHELGDRIKADWNQSGMAGTVELAMTHADQHPIAGHENLMRLCGVCTMYVSEGPTRNNVLTLADDATLPSAIKP